MKQNMKASIVRVILDPKWQKA